METSKKLLSDPFRDALHRHRIKNRLPLNRDYIGMYIMGEEPGYMPKPKEIPNASPSVYQQAQR